MSQKAIIGVALLIVLLKMALVLVVAVRYA